MKAFILFVFAISATAFSAQAEPVCRPQRQVVYEPKKPVVTIVEFGDFQCPYCKRATEVMHQIILNYPDQVRIVFRNLPLDFHANARSAAIAGVCADQQSGFAFMYDYLFANQEQLTPAVFSQGAKAAGLDVAKFEACEASAESAGVVNDDMSEANALHIQGTPSFFISGKSETERVNGVYEYAKYKEIIDRLLK